MEGKNKEIEEILKLVERKKNYHLLQTNINEREDLSQELDTLIFEKLQIYLDQESTSNFYQYLIEKIDGTDNKE